jgi:hypothetical protein
MTDNSQYLSSVGLATEAYRVGGHTAKETYIYGLFVSRKKLYAGSQSDNDKATGNYSQKPQ